MGRLIPGIQVYADTDEHPPEREMVPAPYLQILQAVIIKYPVIDPLAGSPFLIEFLVLLRIPWDAWMETQVCMVLDVNRAAIAARGAFRFIWAFPNAAASEGAAVFMGVLDRVIAPGFHFIPCPAEGMTFFAEGDIIRSIFRGLCPAVDVNKGIDAPVIQKPVSWDVVMGGIQTDVLGGKAKTVTPEVVDGIKEIFAVMTSGIRKFQEDRELHLKGVISAAEHIKGVAEKPGFVVTVPSPSGIWVRIMAWACIPVGAEGRAGSKVPAIRRGM